MSAAAANRNNQIRFSESQFFRQQSKYEFRKIIESKPDVLGFAKCNPLMNLVEPKASVDWLVKSNPFSIDFLFVACG